MKKALFAGLVVLVLFTPMLTFAAVSLSGPIIPPDQQEAQGNTYNLCQLKQIADNIIAFAVELSVIVGTLMFAYGGILYVTASGAGADQIKKAHKVLLNVFFGIVIVLIAWLITNIFVSVLTGQGIEFWTTVACSNNPSYQTFPAAQSSKVQEVANTTKTNLSSGTLSNDAALAQLHAAGVCDTGTSVKCLNSSASLQGIRQSTIDGLIQLHDACGCEFTITSGTDGTHAGGDYSHANGYKVDISTSGNNTPTSYIEQNFSGPVSVIWGGVPSQQYTDGCGNKYTNEGNHWDVGYVYACSYGG